jgi:hypothetical protein
LERFCEALFMKTSTDFEASVSSVFGEAAPAENRIGHKRARRMYATIVIAFMDCGDGADAALKERIGRVSVSRRLSIGGFSASSRERSDSAEREQA